MTLLPIALNGLLRFLSSHPWWSVCIALALLCGLVMLRQRGRKTSSNQPIALPEKWAPPEWDPTDAELEERLRDTLASLEPELSINVARLTNTEIFEAADQKRFLGLSLGTNQAEITVCATFRYGVSLEQPWRIVR